MKKIWTLALVLLCLNVWGQRTIHVVDNKIYSACGEEIVMRGVNEMFIWSQDKTGVNTLPEIAKTGANTVRLVWTSDGSPSELDALIANCLANNMIPVPELHDATGDFSQLQKLLNYWKRPEVLAILQKYKQWVILNIGNEVGAGSETNEQWEAYYEDAIDQLRGVDIDVPLMIDCGSYGSNEDYFLSKGNNLLEHDPLHNIIFSVHTYWVNPDSDQGRKDRLDNLISEAATKKLPFIIGEGPQWAASPWSTYCEVKFPYEYLLKRCEEEGIGWLSWSWGLVDNNDCGAPNSVFDITTDGVYGNWSTDFAEEIMETDPNSIKNTSVIPTSLTLGNCGVEKCRPIQLNTDYENLCLHGATAIYAEDQTYFMEDHSYKWYYNDELIPETNPLYTASQGGYYRLEVDSAGACIVFDDIFISEDITVELGDDQVLCTVDKVDLSIIKDQSSYNVSWFKDDEELFSMANATEITVEESGEYVAKVYSDYCEGTDTLMLESKLPSVKDTVICRGVEATLTVEGEGNYVWYEEPALTNEVNTGSEYRVSQQETKIYYIQDNSGFEGNVGKAALEESFWDTWDAASKTNKLGFEVFETITVESFDVYAQSAGSMNVVFYDASLTTIETMNFNVVSGKNTLQVNKTFDAGVYYADVAGSSVNLRFNHDEGDYTTAYPYTLQNGANPLISIDRTEPSWMKDKPWYLFFYNWKITQEAGAACLPSEMQVDVTDDCITALQKDEGIKGVVVYPNPTMDVLTLSRSSKWKLFDMQGVLLQQGEGSEINLSMVNRGVYLLQIDTQQVKVQKR